MNEKLIIPNHLAIIMDGNGRWASIRNKSRSYGHLKGKDTLKEIAIYAFELGVKVLSVFAFSTENFKRDKDEVDYLMNLFISFTSSELEIFVKNNIRIVVSRTKKGLPKKVEEAIIKLEERTKNNTRAIFNICLNYGGRKEIVDTTKKLVKKVMNNEISIDDIDESIFEKNLYYELPPIDLLIRTSGEVRISNFMLFQLAYSEMYFPSYYFPDMKKKDLDEAILIFNKKDRRFGGVNEKKSI